jgi:hypothetical protein
MKKSPILMISMLALVTLALSTAFAADSPATITLQSQRKAGQTDKVVTLLEVSGEFKEREKGKEQQVPMRGVDKLVYHEKTLDADLSRLRSVRYYEKAESAVKFKDGEHAPVFGDSSRLVGAAVDLPAVTLFSLREPLTRDELEVIDILGNSLLLDSLLPDGPVAVGQSWKPDDKAMAALMGLNSVKRNDVKCVLKEVTETVARFELTGDVEGPINDTTSRIEIKGKYRFDLGTHKIDWFALLVKENRGASLVAVGFDVTVRLQMTITPEEACEELAQGKLEGLKTEPEPESSRLAFESPNDRWRLLYDRRWFLNSDDQEIALLKLIDQGAFLGVCKITSLPRCEPDKLVSLEDFQEEVHKVLGKKFGEFAEAGQSADPATRLRVLRVVAQGKTDDVPTRWFFYHVADQQGRQVTFTFTVDQENVERFADSDKPIVGSLRFAELEKGEKAKGEGREAKGEARQGNKKG